MGLQNIGLKLAKVAPLADALDQFWKGHYDINHARVVQRRFLDGSIVTFVFSQQRSDSYWDRFFQSFSPRVRINSEDFDIELEPLSPPDLRDHIPDLEEPVKADQLKKRTYERAYRISLCLPLPFFVRLRVCVLGVKVSIFTVSHTLSRVSENGGQEVYSRTHTVEVSSVQPYKT